jgi:hypothetical protein
MSEQWALFIVGVVLTAWSSIVLLSRRYFWSPEDRARYTRKGRDDLNDGRFEGLGPNGSRSIPWLVMKWYLAPSVLVAGLTCLGGWVAAR